MDQTQLESRWGQEESWDQSKRSCRQSQVFILSWKRWDHQWRRRKPAGQWVWPGLSCGRLCLTGSCSLLSQWNNVLPSPSIIAYFAQSREPWSTTSTASRHLEKDGTNGDTARAGLSERLAADGEPWTTAQVPPELSSGQLESKMLSSRSWMQRLCSPISIYSL